MIKNLLKLSKPPEPKIKKFFSLFAVSINELENISPIQFEKRRRNQAYCTLDYMLSRITYFDFFSADTFQIAKYAKYFAQYVNSKIVTPELLLLACFYCDSSLSSFFSSYEIDDIIELLGLGKKKEKNDSNTFLNFSNFLESFKNDSSLVNEDLEYSFQVNQIFSKAAENSLTRFKNPVITSEILFLTLMDEKNYPSFRLIKKIFKTEGEWYLIRYQLLKHLHLRESNIRNEVSKNQQYFAYLLKTQLSEKQFDKLIQKASLENGVLSFRNLLVYETMQTNLLNVLLDEVKKSIKITTTRVYSSLSS